MRVGIVIHSLAGGGAERAAISLTSGLARRGLDAHLFCVRHGGELVADAHQQVPSIQYLTKLTQYSAERRPAWWKSTLGVVRGLRSQPADALILNSFPSTELILLLKRLRIIKSKVVTVYHNSIVRHTADIFKAPVLQRIYLRVFRFLIQASDIVVTPSLGASRELESVLRLTKGSVHTIYNPVNENFLLQHLTYSTRVPKLFDALTRPIVMSVGRLEPQKNFNDLIRAFGEATRGSGGSLVILGNGTCRDDLTELSVQLGIADRVLLPGFVNDIYGAMAMADVMAWSSNYEGFSIAMLEAAVMGKRIVSYDSPHGPSELASFFPIQIQLVPLGSVDLLASELERSISRPASSQIPPMAIPSPFLVDSYAEAFAKLLTESDSHRSVNSQGP